MASVFGVKVEAATRDNLEKSGYPLSGALDTVLLRNEKDTPCSQEDTRRAHTAASYRILPLMGDNLRDFVDGCKQRHAERL